MKQDFEIEWRERYHDCVAHLAGKENLISSLDPDLGAREWTEQALGELRSRFGREKAEQVLSDCACQYPTESLKTARQTYELTKSVDAVMEVLQEQFEIFLEKVLSLDPEQILEIKRQGMGSAGRREGSRIIATKIPKSGNIQAWFHEQDPVKKAELYCHCPRVHEYAATEDAVPELYCYCGAGFYKGIWEEILQRPVKVEVLETVQHHAASCRIAIDLPPDVVTLQE